MLWLQLAVAGGIIIFTGTRLSKIGDGIAERKKWGRTYVGFLLIAFSTSLPELFISCSAAGIEKQPDFVYGNIFGSIAFNTTLFALMDFVEGRGPFSLKLNTKLLLTGNLSILLILIAALNILVYPHLSIGWVGMGSWLILLVYILSSRMMYNLSREETTTPSEENSTSSSDSCFGLWLGYAACALVILGGGLWLTRVSESIVQATHLSRSFVGVVFLGIISSLPELATTVAAVKLGFYGMAIGIIFGANCYNILMLFFADSLYTRGPLSAHVSQNNLVMMLVGICLTIILTVGVIYRSKKSFLRLGWDAIAIIILYLSSVFWLYKPR